MTSIVMMNLSLDPYTFEASLMVVLDMKLTLGAQQRITRHCMHHWVLLIYLCKGEAGWFFERLFGVLLPDMQVELLGLL